MLCLALHLSSPLCCHPGSASAGPSCLVSIQGKMTTARVSGFDVCTLKTFQCFVIKHRLPLWKQPLIGALRMTLAESLTIGTQSQISASLCKSPCLLPDTTCSSLPEERSIFSSPTFISCLLILNSKSCSRLFAVYLNKREELLLPLNVNLNSNSRHLSGPGAGSCWCRSWAVRGHIRHNVLTCSDGLWGLCCLL